MKCALCGGALRDRRYRKPELVSTATSTATASAALLAGGHWPCFCDGHIPPTVFGSVEFLNCIGGFLIRRHFNKTETFTAAGIAIGNDLRGLNVASLREDLLKRLIRRTKRKVANVKLLTHVPP